ncbi:hypothetical protein COCOBI_14-4010 [Coccomyxa sp. Obi]|nr:hypothetical protein COCOBI_14-4010 [Coccomyxa sp. Obi]
MMVTSQDVDTEHLHFMKKTPKSSKKPVRILPSTSSADSDTEASLPVREDLPSAQEFLLRPGLGPTYLKKCRFIWSSMRATAAKGTPDLKEKAIRESYGDDHTISRMLRLMLRDGIVQRKGRGGASDPYKWRVTARSMFLPHYAKEDLETGIDSTVSQKRRKWTRIVQPRSVTS